MNEKMKVQNRISNKALLARICAMNDQIKQLQSDLAAHRERCEDNVERILRAVRNQRTDYRVKRSSEQIRLIDLAVSHFVTRLHVEHMDKSKRACFMEIWKRQHAERLFKNYKNFENAIYYDMIHRINVPGLIALKKAEAQKKEAVQREESRPIC